MILLFLTLLVLVNVAIAWLMIKLADWLTTRRRREISEAWLNEVIAEAYYKGKPIPVTERTSVHSVKNGDSAGILRKPLREITEITSVESVDLMADGRLGITFTGKVKYL